MMSKEQCYGIAQLSPYSTTDPSTSKHSLPRIDWGNPQVDEIVQSVRKGEVSTRAAAKKLSVILQRKVSHTTMQRRANNGEDKKSAKRGGSGNDDHERSDDSIRIIEPSVSNPPSLNDRMDPFASKKWLEESNGYESYRITSSPTGGQSVLEVWISPNLVRRYRACGRRDTVTHYRCATCDSLSFDVTQPGRTLSVQEGRVVGFLCPKHDVRCVPVEAPTTVISPKLRLGEANGRKRPHHSIGDTESELSVPSESPPYSLSPDSHEQMAPEGSASHGTRRSRTLLDWDSGESRSVLLAVKNGEITLRQAAEKLSAMVGKPIAHTTLHRRLKNFVLNQQSEDLEAPDQNENVVVDDTTANLINVDEEISYANIRTIQNSQIVAALQEVAGGISSLRDELSGIRGALSDLKDPASLAYLKKCKWRRSRCCFRTSLIAVEIATTRDRSSPISLSLLAFAQRVNHHPAMASEDSYESVLKSRYTRNSPLLTILSETHKTQTWRQLWIWLAEAEKELGLKQVTDEAIAEMKANRDVIDWPTIRDEERRLKHDVMAHNHSYGKICPKAAGIIHLGATSCFVQDNADLIVQRDSIDHILKGMATCIDRLAKFAEKTVDVVTVGRTHYQTASLTTVGKRAVLWAQELVMAFDALTHFRNETMRFRGIKGATGTQDSFLTLFDGDEELVEKLDELVMKKAGFTKRFRITGQTYSRQQDIYLMNALGAFAAAAKKICLDIRVLQAFGELLEPFEEHQIGSSAMPYKKNPMKSERVCSLFHRLVQAPNEALLTLADQGLERTLDDSANRRVNIPDSFLLAESMLRTLQNIFEGLTVQEENVARIVHDELPFLALEKAMMWLTESGVDRQQAHAKIREAALNAKEQQKTRSVSIHDTLQDPFFDSVRDRVVAIASDPIQFTGRCRSQVQTYLKEELYPTIEKYLDKNVAKISLDV